MSPRFVSALALVLGLVALAGPGRARAGEKEAPHGIGKIAEAYAPPELASFPPGTVSVRALYTAPRAPGVCTVAWEFERAGPEGPLVPRHGDVDVLTNAPSSFVLPPAPPGQGPLASVKALLTAYHQGDLESMRRYLGTQAMERIAEAPERFRENIGEMERTLGSTLPDWAEKGLPRLRELPAGAGALELRYRYAGTSQGKGGYFEIRLRLHVSSLSAPNWTLEGFDPVFTPSAEEAGVKADGAVAPDGLGKILGDFAVPDFSSFPKGTTSLRVKCWGRRGGGLFEIRAEFETHSGSLFLEGFTVKPRDSLGRGRVTPAKPPAEGPIDAIRSLAVALVKKEYRKAWSYIPAKQKDHMAERSKGFETFRKDIEAEVSREEARRGFSPLKVIPPHLPVAGRTPAGLAGLELKYAFPGQTDAGKGVFRFELGVLTEREDASNWVVDRLETDFRLD